MRVAFVANSAWYLRNFRLSTLQAFTGVHEVSVHYPEGGAVSAMNSLGLTQHPFYLDSSGTHPLKELRGLLALWRSLRRARPEVVFSFNPKTNLYALMACWLMRVPCIPNVSGVGNASQLGGAKGRLYRTLAGFFYRRAAHVFFQNSDDCEAFLRAGWVREGCYSLIPGSGVDLARFAPTLQTGAKPRPFRFLMAARLLAAKGVREYCAASRALLAVHSGVECWLAGGLAAETRGVSEAELDAWHATPGADYLGHVDDMASLLHEVDVVVLPSYYPEGIPRSLIEAAACGKLLITTTMPGCREVVVPGENGWQVPPRDEQALLAAMSAAMTLSPQERAAMQQASRELAERRFDEQIVIQQYQQVLAQQTSQGVS
ncbi:glycosyltransferase family 4 protein [Halomonas saccharevitans]|uniref:Glycosyltransferase family 4 protein n=1 Tax=Halomonas saccharevitans TaxID=416872 RepID=A0ABU3NDL2_9GAMM|nr:glycosyltransferase family 4 protein [Halomonas saccharevitans]MDT8878302.1 glycosyltransferase family 4 protein [Halomonas saccharevitans]